MIRWEKIRDDVTCEVYHKMYDSDYPKPVAVIRKAGKASKPYRVQILDRIPWHRKTLKIAKADAEHIYLHC